MIASSFGGRAILRRCGGARSPDSGNILLDLVGFDMMSPKKSDRKDDDRTVMVISATKQKIRR
jgi:hypothetical protein